MPDSPTTPSAHDYGFPSPDELTARLQQVGGKLKATVRSSHAKQAAQPVEACVHDLRCVWSQLREMTIDYDPTRVATMQERERELWLALGVLHGAVASVSTATDKADTTLSHQLEVFDKLCRVKDSGAWAPHLDAAVGTVRGATNTLKSTIDHAATEVTESGKIVADVGTKLAQAAAQTPRDRLTRVLNREAFIERLAALAAESSLLAGYWSVLLVELYHLEAVNKKLGDRVGDALLFRVAGLLRDACDFLPAAAVARTSGKEFGVLLPRCPLSDGRRFAENVRSTVGKARWECRVATARPVIGTTVSIGLAEFRDGESPEDLLERAESCLAAARTAGRNTIVASG